ncbi:MAG: DNA polymerase III subunit gamma/tau [Candidatus Omnitrophica bacterium]|nr:DNA polymerase III subunit gamma/tau [Candidatus Omnitrophota bacterium]
MSYLVFARKYRPQTLNDLVGQEHVSITLRNALTQGRVAQSFLFSGTRGVGKTSAARILAKMINCQNIKPGEDPCGKCLSCQEITVGNSLDVLEIDGASNRGIDEIRNLRDTVKFKPMSGLYKIIIIDEVHMLTGEAFNALLKTLEEPPAHVKFIFATTEAHKVPLTILSRCQRFQFRRIPTGAIVATLEAVSKKEGVKAEREALFVMARQAEGSLRDAESLFEQMISFSGRELKKEDVERSLGIPPHSALFSFVEAISKHEAKRVLELLEDLLARGEDAAFFVTGLLETFRALLLSEVMEQPGKLLEMSEESEEALRKLKGRFSKNDLFMILEALQELAWKVRRSANPRILVEVALLELASRESVESISALVSELRDLKKNDKSFPVPVNPEPAEQKSQAQPQKNFSNPKASSEPSVITPPKSAGSVSLRATAAFDIADFRTQWPEIVEAVKAVKISAGNFLAEAEPVAGDGKELVIGFPEHLRFHKEVFEKLENAELVRRAVIEKTGITSALKFVVLGRAYSTYGTAASGIDPAVRDRNAEEKVPDIITEAMNLFEGRILRKD